MSRLSSLVCLAWFIVVMAISKTAVSSAQESNVAGAAVETSNGRLFVVDTGGRGVPVLLLHATTGSSLSWEHQLPALRAAGYRAIAYDRRGFGRSPTGAGARLPTGADDLEALVTALKIDRFHLVGTAGGGFVALDYALSFPGRLRALVIANSIGGVQDADYQELGRQLRPPPFDSLPPEVRELGPAYRAANPEGTKRWVDVHHRSWPDLKAPAAQPMKNVVTFERLQAIATPTLLLTGGADLYAPPPILKMFERRIRNATSVVVPEAGHSTAWEQPDAFNRAILDFLARH